jgi:hypothetical protein
MNYIETDFEAKILNDFLMQQELSIQKGIHFIALQIKRLNSSDINTLLQLQIEGTGTLVALWENKNRWWVTDGFL